MIIRELRLSDLVQIDQFWQRDHKGIRGIPSRENIITDAVVENGRILGYGQVKVFGEALLFLNQNASQFEKAKTFKLLMDKAIDDSQKLNLETMHVGIDNDHFESILREKYKFDDRGKVLYLGLENGIRT